MNVEQLTELFQWMTIINVGVFVLSSVLIMVLKKSIYKMHADLFGIQEDQVAIAVYSYLGRLKILILVFNIVPYLSLLLIR